MIEALSHLPIVVKWDNGKNLGCGSLFRAGKFPLHLAGAFPALANAIANGLQHHAAVRLAMVFGSQARGTAHATSDLDVAVQGYPLDGLLLASEPTVATGYEVDVVDLSDLGYPLLNAIVRDGITVYEGAPGAAARWRTRALLILDTDRIWFERIRDGYLAKLASKTDAAGSR